MEGLFFKAQLHFINYFSFVCPSFHRCLHLEHGMFAYLPFITYSLINFSLRPPTDFFCPWLKQVDGNLSSQVCVGASSFSLFG